MKLLGVHVDSKCLFVSRCHSQIRHFAGMWTVFPVVHTVKFKRTLAVGGTKLWLVGYSAYRDVSTSRPSEGRIYNSDVFISRVG